MYLLVYVSEMILIHRYWLQRDNSTTVLVADSPDVVWGKPQRADIAETEHVSRHVSPVNFALFSVHVIQPLNDAFPKPNIGYEVIR